MSSREATTKKKKKVDKETNIEHLRNKLSPFLNLAAIVKDNSKSESIQILEDSRLAKLWPVLVSNAKTAYENQKEIIKLINLIEKENEFLKNKNKELIEFITNKK